MPLSLRRMRIATLLGMLLTTSCAGSRPHAVSTAASPPAATTELAPPPAAARAALEPPSGRMGFGKRRVDRLQSNAAPSELTAFYGE